VCIGSDGGLWLFQSSFWRQVGTGVVRNAISLSMTQFGHLWVSTVGGEVFFGSTDDEFVTFAAIPAGDPAAGPNDCLAVVASIGRPGEAEANAIVPKPQTIATYAAFVSFDADNFTFTSVGESSDILTRALARYPSLTFPTPAVTVARGTGVVDVGRQHYQGTMGMAGVQGPVASGIDVQVLSNDTTLGLQTNENYTLYIEAPRLRLVATTVFGALRGLETLSQLVSELSPPGAVPGLLTLRWQTVTDYPRFAYRGLMIDPARR